MSRASFFFASFASLLLSVGVVRAADENDPRLPPTELVKRPQTNGGGIVEVRANLGVGLSKGHAGKPLVLAPSLYYSFTDDLEIGVNHNGSLCLSGCGKAYNDVGLDGYYSFLRGPIALSAHAGFYDVAIDPGFLQARAGVLVTIPAGDRFAFYLDPQLFFGVTKRDAGNREVLSVPFRAAFQATSQLAVFVDSGLFGTLSRFGDTWTTPIAPGALYAINRRFDVGAKLSFDRPIAAHEGTADARTLSFFGTARF